MGIMDVLEGLSGPEYDEPAEPITTEAPEATATADEAETTEPPAAPVTDGETPVPQQMPVLEVSPPEITAILDQAYPEETEVIASLRKRVHLRPELIMAIIAGLAAVLLVAVVILCMPYFSTDEDPESLPQRHENIRATEPVQEIILEPTVPETEPEKPTIPPDPNPYGRNDFQYNRQNYLTVLNVESWPGVDVSAYQGDIDWEAVARSGIEFAIIRLGYRGYESGKLVEDEYARKNLEEAKNAGLKVGAYFFSQALTFDEVDEEINFMLDILGEHYLAMPLVLDWEIPTSTARSARMDARTLTDLQLYFCQKVSDIGYQPMIYFNWHQSEHLYYLSELEDYPFWLALYQDRMTYPWKVEMWQYTSSGRVPGIAGDVDINVYMPY